MLSLGTDNMGAVFTRMLDININKIPLNPFEVIVSNCWHLSSYRAFEKTIGMSSDEIQQQISPRAFSFYSSTEKSYFIIYNSKLEISRVHFNLAHEIGHILYGHISESMPVICKHDAGKLERDALADQFARFVLQLK